MSIRKAKKEWKKWMLKQGWIVKKCEVITEGGFGFLYSDINVFKVKKK